MGLLLAHGNIDSARTIERLINTRELFHAIEEGDINRADALVKSGKIDINHKNKFGRTPLMEAVRSENFAMVKLLCENGADINLTVHDDASHKAGEQAVTKATYNALLIAAENNLHEIMTYLLEQGADTEVKTKINNTVLLHAASRDCELETLRILILHCAHIKVKNKKGESLEQILGIENFTKLMLGLAAPIPVSTPESAKSASTHTSTSPTHMTVGSFFKKVTWDNKVPQVNCYSTMSSDYSPYDETPKGTCSPRSKLGF